MREQASLFSQAMIKGSSIRNLPNAEKYDVSIDKKTGAIRRTLKAKHARRYNTNTGRGNSAALIAEEDQLFKKIMGIGGVK